MTTRLPCLLALMMMLCSSTALNPDHEPFCLHTQFTLGRTECTFLRRSAAAESLLLYRTLWTSDQHVQECSVSAEEALIQNHITLCRRERTWDLNRTHLNLSLLWGAGGSCAFQSLPEEPGRNLDSGHQVGDKIRKKRAWILPGTLWCGQGSSAGEYEQLGMFEHVDRCCREHDHCSHVIRPFTVKFGVLNPSFFTISHCDCDQRFKQCLLNSNDTVSNMVGYTFFNLLKLRCFNLVQKRHCTQLNWFGRCTSVRAAPFAILRNPTSYNVSSPSSESIRFSDPPVPQVRPSANSQEKSINPRQRGKQSRKKFPQRKIHPGAIPRGDTFLPSKKTQKRKVKTKKVSPLRRNQTTTELRTSSGHTSVTITPSSVSTQITHVHTTLSPSKGFSAENPVDNQWKTLSKISSNISKAKNKTMQLQISKRLKAKQSYRIPPGGYNFQSTQQKTKDFKMLSASNLKSVHATAFSLSNTFLTSNKLKKQDNSTSTNSPNNKTVSTKLPRPKSSATKSFLNTTKQKVKGQSKKTPANITQAPKTRNSTAAKLTAATKSRGSPWKDSSKSLKNRIKDPPPTKQESVTPAKGFICAKRKCKPPKSSSILKNASEIMTLTSGDLTPKQKATSAPELKMISSTETMETLSSSPRNETNPPSEETTGSMLICDAVKHLDDCEYKIRPLEKLYGHYNKESTTIYYCDCIHRFTDHLKQLQEAGILELLLGKFVSLSCIEMPNSQECNKTTGCPAIISKTPHRESSLKNMEGDQAIAKRITLPIKKKGPGQLYKHCLRILKPKTPNQVKKRLS
ncbi:uncharacterized protein [Hoplias malabaricus]|uniref:uncharacterized protein n=1 Tax=Hoplias malabaricus TaxID=27720 RepID=UPI003461EFFA